MANTIAAKPVTTPEEINPASAGRDRLIRQGIMAKITTTNHTKVDIKPVGVNRFRVNVWAETGKKSEGDYFNERLIAQSFYHIHVD